MDEDEHNVGLALHAGLAALIGVLVLAIWGLTGGGAFWPGWVWVGVGLPVALHAGAVRANRHSPPGRQRGLAHHAAVYVSFGGTLIVIWLLSGSESFWPVWPLLALSAILAAHAVVDRLLPHDETQQLTERVDELTRTRRGALDVQAAELRRIERDLHDGAQARLVALSMKLGRAEERLADQPEVAELVRQARGEASAAIAELRDLARGIAPPVLVDRGLAAAVQSLATRSPIEVTVDVSMDRRPAPVIETAAYFVAAETLTNVAKHAREAKATVTIVLANDLLTVTITDDGPGGADPQGGGLTGLRNRVEALDGTLSVVSGSDGTTVKAELPCGS
jgi:signal transduction histidine kinase